MLKFNLISFFKKFFISLILFGFIIINVSLCSTKEIKEIKFIGINFTLNNFTLNKILKMKNGNLNIENTSNLIKFFYKTGLFKNVEIKKKNNILIVKLIKKLLIDNVKIVEMENIKYIEKIMWKNNVSEGKLYNLRNINNARKDIRKFYRKKGYYNPNIKIQIKKRYNNKLEILIKVKKNNIIKIKNINIVGNTIFKDTRLKNILKHKETNFFSFLKKNNYFIKEKLNSDLETIKLFYMDKGYINFQFNSICLLLNKNKKYAYVNINISEGNKYFFGDIKLNGRFKVSRKKINSIINLYMGNKKTFSRKIFASLKYCLLEYFGEQGYNNIGIYFDFITDEKLKVVNIQIRINVNNKIKVRKINIIGNKLTQDIIIRKNINQLENNWISNNKIKSCKEKIVKNGIAKDIVFEMQKVKNYDNLSDITFKIIENKTTKFLANTAYSGSDGFILGLGADFTNFIGSGNDINFNLEKGKYTKDYSLGYFNPNFIKKNIGMGYNIYYQKISLGSNSNIFDYLTNTFGTKFFFNLPTFNKKLKINLGFGYDKIDLNLNENIAPLEIQEFILYEGIKFYEYFINLGIKYNSLDRYIFPTLGSVQHLNLKTTVLKSKLKYYKIDYNLNYFKSINKNLVIHLSNTIGYGNKYSNTKKFPFFINYFTGGADSIRGFEERSLVPKDSEGKYFGGNFLLNFKASLMFPVLFFSNEKNVKMSIFFDMGNVYDTINKYRIRNGKKYSRNPNKIKLSSGISMIWNTPFGAPIEMSIAKPIIFDSNDKKQAVSFTFGMQFL